LSQILRCAFGGVGAAVSTPCLDRGFSLVEVLVVMAVLAVILGSAAPSFVTFLQAQQTRSAAYDLTSDLLLARSEALTRNTRVAIISSASGLRGGWRVATLVDDTTIAARSEAPQTLVFRDAPEVISFDENGRLITPTNDIRITIFGGGSQRCVEIDLAGRARTLIGACS